MAFVDFFTQFKQLTVNEGINRSRTEKNAVLVDVRSKEDFNKKHVKGAINIPLNRMDLIKGRIPDKTKHLYVIGSTDYRPSKAVKPLKKLGYTNITLSGLMEAHHVEMM